MKKQINPTIKAHLLRGALYLLLLVAVCAIPFALAQRNKLSSTKAQPTKAPPTKAQAAAASGKVYQSGAAGALAGRAAPAKPSAGQTMLPYDVRPNLAAGLLGHHTGVGKNASRIGNNPLLTYMIDDGTAEDSVGLTAGGNLLC